MTTIKRIQRGVIAVVGSTVLVIGIALMVLPGPAFLVIPAGLAILAIEFAWARRWLRRARALVGANRSPAQDANSGERSLPRRRPLAALARWWRKKRRLRRPASKTSAEPIV